MRNLIVSYRFAARSYICVPAGRIYVHLYIFTFVCPIMKLVTNFEVNLKKIIGCLSQKMMMQTCTGGKKQPVSKFLLVSQARAASLILWMLEERVELASAIVFSSTFLSVPGPIISHLFLGSVQSILNPPPMHQLHYAFCMK